ncbi:MAG: hypothetical protein A2X87_02775 [Deltaproteobacteria bacterium GWC2_42_51]|nr:MAG: hypothetical protein A2056_00535 [Deltaproteobacteria bacterium GWA2_42_85]OGP36599.1 MAG: hypothetical protein A2X87_02775 [Deltaproteobacteria bacterium GWC2_42_51]OGP40250.1 MAG: hypothetical protein A2090_10845 [Deltaproteobacteria bacterium GWD2_42_10]OGQ26941.1 MAG: hypothetical protein A3D29_04020 [Deltaproteobacteria bacterium RIFCSPHIGHO2_02_FULL_42_44]OGQ36338.1 MAG: hypothetical protein A3H47_09085 [Deltaproteobacteria bacterium RIFCSPLOWO2_02_FULL_42_39]
MKRIHSQYQEKGLIIIGLGFQDTKDNLIKYAKEMKIDDWALVLDVDGHVSAKYGVVYGAGTVLINRDEIVTKRFIAGLGENEFLPEVEKIVK